MLTKSLKRTILINGYSQPMSCCFWPSPLDAKIKNTLERLLMFCQHFGGQCILLMQIEWILLIRDQRISYAREKKTVDAMDNYCTTR